VFSHRLCLKLCSVTEETKRTWANVKEYTIIFAVMYTKLLGLKFIRRLCGLCETVTDKNIKVDTLLSVFFIFRIFVLDF